MMLERLFPGQADNRFAGHRAALWLLGLLIALRLVMSVRSIFETRSVAAGDGIPLDSFGAAAAQQVLTLFALMALAQLALVLIALAVLIRYRALVPFIYLVLLCEQLARRFIVASQQAARAETAAIIWYLVYGLLALTALGLVLSLLPGRGGRGSAAAS